MPFVLTLLACVYSFLKFSFVLQGSTFIWAPISRGGNGKCDQSQAISPRDLEMDDPEVCSLGCAVDFGPFSSLHGWGHCLH